MSQNVSSEVGDIFAAEDSVPMVGKTAEHLRAACAREDELAGCRLSALFKDLDDWEAHGPYGCAFLGVGQADAAILEIDQPGGVAGDPRDRALSPQSIKGERGGSSEGELTVSEKMVPFA